MACCPSARRAFLLLLLLATRVSAGVHVVEGVFAAPHGEPGLQRAPAAVSFCSDAGRPGQQPSLLTPQLHLESRMGDGWVTIFHDGFEGDFPEQWQVGDLRLGPGEYHWGKRDCRAYEGSYSAWAVGAGEDGALLPCSSEYPYLAYSYMVYGPFSLADASAAELTFRLWLNSQPDVDSLFWGFSTDGQHFRGGAPATGTSDGWVERTLDLDEVTGETDVWIAFIFFSDEKVRLAEGAHVDNVTLRKLRREYGANLPIVCKDSSLVFGLSP